MIKALSRDEKIYVVDETLSIDEILDMLERSRSAGDVYATAILVQAARKRGMLNARLTQSDRTLLIAELCEARSWRRKWTRFPSSLPQGYGIAAMLSATKSLMPEFPISILDRDVRLIRRAADKLRINKHIHGVSLLDLLIKSAKDIGVSLEA